MACIVLKFHFTKGRRLPGCHGEKIQFKRLCMGARLVDTYSYLNDIKKDNNKKHVAKILWNKSNYGKIYYKSTECRKINSYKRCLKEPLKRVTFMKFLSITSIFHSVPNEKIVLYFAYTTPPKNSSIESRESNVYFCYEIFSLRFEWCCFIFSLFAFCCTLFFFSERRAKVLSSFFFILKLLVARAHLPRKDLVATTSTRTRRRKKHRDY